MLALPFILHTNELLQYNILRSFVFFTSKEQNALVLIQSSQ